MAISCSARISIESERQAVLFNIERWATSYSIRGDIVYASYVGTNAAIESAMIQTFEMYPDHSITIQPEPKKGA